MWTICWYLLVLSISNDALDDFESDIAQRFSMQTQDIADAFAGFELRDASNGEAFMLSQGQYNRSMAQLFAVDERLRPRTPMDDSFPSRARLDMELLNESFRPVIGSLLYSSTVTRSYLALYSVALTAGVKECLGLKLFLEELGLQPAGRIIAHEDNQGAQHLAEGKAVTQRSKHIDLRYHWLREQVRSGVIELKYCPTRGMIADILTKPLGGQTFASFVDMLELRRVGVLEQ
ncbi:unnamed protein product [Phytophthora fragariaefolia]|uniref:Unnamed protein product n=1 Tax=Phytophthora fragariaefolia TaxID=1490495 RepID=A0A9W6Y636_9STRA|nr:unnamed protein product [Phytophthora fragariaefolia]